MFGRKPTKITQTVPYTIYRVTLVHTPELGLLEVLTDMLIGVDPEGIIEFLEPAAKYVQDSHHFHPRQIPRFRAKSLRYVDLHNRPCQFLAPGFVDTHIHASQYPNVGIGSELPLLDWLKQYTFPLESMFTDANPDKLEFAKSVYSKVIDKALRNGTTTASYFATVDAETTNIFADLLVEKGQRGFVGKVCMDCNPSFPTYEELYDDCIRSMKSVIRHCERLNPDSGATFNVKPIITPRFAPLCTRKLLRKLGEMAKSHQLPVQTHISENLEEIKLVKELFPECDNYASVYKDHDLLGPATIMAHAIHLTKEERKIFREQGCSISHCPLSNTFITSGEAPVKQLMYEDKINVSLGTDLSGGYEQSILGVARSAIMVSHHLAMHTEDYDPRISVGDALYMATMGGAKAVGMGSLVGSFAVGKTFDAQLIDVDSHTSNVDVFPFQVPQAGPDYEKQLLLLIHRWIFSGDDRNCVKVWCNGREVVNRERNNWVYVEGMDLDD